MLKATVQGLQSLRRPDEVAATRGLTISQVLPISAKPAEEEQPAEPVTAQQEQPAEPVTEQAPSAAADETTSNDGEAEDHPDA
jgi:small subunit ribosomal protein S5